MTSRPVVDSTAPVPRVRRASIHMEAMGLWRPPLGLDEPAQDFAHPGPTATGSPACPP